jgi:DNA-binding transcriptional LysR family regulator
MNESMRFERRISLHDLRVLMSVVQAGSMGKAAKLLATSQPAVSRSIAELEHALGVRLLDRSAQGIEPTSYGRALLRRGTVVFDELQQGVKDIRFLADPTTGDLSIGASIAIAEGFVASVIGRLSARYPRLTFQVHATDTAIAYRALVDRRVDLAIVHVIEPLTDESMHVEPLLRDPHVVIAGAQNPLTRRRRLRLSDLVNEPWALSPPDSPYGAVVFEAFRAHGLRVPPTVVHSTLPLRTTLLATGRFLSMVPRVVMQFPPKNELLRTLPIDLPTTVRPLALITLKNRTLNPVAQLFTEWMRGAAKPLRKM